MAPRPKKKGSKRTLSTESNPAAPSAKKAKGAASGSTHAASERTPRTTPPSQPESLPQQSHHKGLDIEINGTDEKIASPLSRDDDHPDTGSSESESE